MHPGFLAGLCLLSHLVLPGGQLDQSAHHDLYRPCYQDLLLILGVLVALLVLVVQSALAVHLILVHPLDLECLETLLDQTFLAVLGVPLGLSSPLIPGVHLSP